MGTEGTIWINNFLRTGFEMFSTGKGDDYVAEKTEVNNGWLFPVGDESHDLGYPNMFTDMFESIEKKHEPLESFYDGYIVNTILDAAYKSAETKNWEPVIIEDWRGDEPDTSKIELNSYDDEHFLIKEEILPNGDVKTILKHKVTGAISQIVES